MKSGQRGQRVVCVLCPGDLEHAGGIGRMLGYLFDAWQGDVDAPVIRLIDTRGPYHIVLAPLFFLSAMLQVASLSIRGRVELLHVNLASRGSALRKLVISGLASILRVPTLIHLHGAKFDLFYRGLPGPGRAAVRWMFNRASRIVVLGEYWRNFVVSEMGIPGERVQIIYNGVPSPAARHAARNDGTCHVLFLGRLGARKGVPELLGALASEGIVDKPWRATLAGDGEIEYFGREVERLGLSGRVELTGWVNQQKVSELLGQADIFVLPSHQEGLPVAVLEALAHKVAVVATPVGALPEILVDGQSALMVAPGNVEQLATALRRLLTDPALRERIAEGGWSLFRDRFEVSRIARAFSGAYIAVANGR